MRTVIKKAIDGIVYHMPGRLRINAERFYPPVAFINYYKEIIKDDFLGLEYKRNKQFVKLKNMLKYAQEKVPYYRNLFKTINFSVDNFNNFSDLSAIPILTKECFQTNASLFISDDFKTKNLLPKFTSGTTAMPLCFFFTPQVMYYWGAVRKKQYNIAGVDIRDPHIVIAEALSKNILMRYHKGIIYINPFRLDLDSLDNIINFLRKQSKFKFILGFPAFLHILAQRINELNVLIRPLKAVITTSECLTEENRKIVESVFGCQVFDYYSMHEGVIHGIECECHAGFHLEMNSSFVEQVTIDKVFEGKRIIATGLTNHAMPLIRYDTGDVGFITEQSECRCGRRGPFLTKLYGRFSNLVRLSDGTTYDRFVLSKALQNFSGIRESRFVYYPPDKIVFEMVRSESPLDRERLYKNLSDLFSKKISFKIQEVLSIPRSNNGKTDFICIVDKNFKSN